MFCIAYPLKCLCFGYLWSCVPSQRPEGTLRVRQTASRHNTRSHQPLCGQAPCHLQGKHIRDYPACVEDTKPISLSLVLLAAIQGSRHREDSHIADARRGPLWDFCMQDLRLH